MSLHNILSQHWFTIQDVLFPSLREKLGPITEGHRKVILTLDVVRVEGFIRFHYGDRGRPPKDRIAIANAFIAKAVLNMPTTRSLLDRLSCDPVLRRICGFEKKLNIPKECTFSRAFNEFSFLQLPQRVHEALIKIHYESQLVGHVSRDSTAIVGRERRQKQKQTQTKKQESGTGTGTGTGTGSGSGSSSRSRSRSDSHSKALPKEKEFNSILRFPKFSNSEVSEVVEVVEVVETAESIDSNDSTEATEAPRKRRRGRPKKKDKATKEPTRLERQLSMSLEEIVDDLPKGCDLGCKMSKGYKETWSGYKFHIDVADGQIPISCLLTSASLHDNQAAIPLSKMTRQRITNLYDLMDSAYDSSIIREHSVSLGHVPIIEVNPRRNSRKREELKLESKRLRLLNIQYPEAVRYNERTTVERVNGRLKDEFGGKMVRVRGHAKVMAHLMFGIVALTADQLMRFIM